jgi:glycine/D-amino acid oxidase-like deaminating enzyme
MESTTPQKFPFSFWQTQLQQTDIVVVGGGLVGLTAAASLAQARPSARVVVLEQGLMPDGASVRNAGFACFGSPSELVEDSQHRPPDQIAELVALRVEGLRRLRELLGDAAIGYQPTGGYDLLLPGHAPVVETLADWNARLRPIFGTDAFVPLNDWPAAWPFDRSAFAGAVALPHEGLIDTGRLGASLLRRAALAGVRWVGGQTVERIERHADGFRLAVAGADGRPYSWQASQVALCTNATAARLRPELDVTPGRGQVWLTEPLGLLNWTGAFHVDAGYTYFRPVGDRLLIGGGRNLDFEGEATAEHGFNPIVDTWLGGLLRQTLLPHQRVEVAARWSGIMGFTGSGLPIVRELEPGLAAGVGLNGMGVALGSLVGEAVADLLLGRPGGALLRVVSSVHEAH